MKESLYVWFDTEYSDLDLESAALLQVAAVVTDASLRRVLPAKDDVALAIRLPSGRAVSTWVQEHVPELVKLCRSPEATPVEEADDILAARVDAARCASSARERPILAGNSVHLDWRLARRFLPRFLDRLHYRLLDVTAFKLEWKRLHPDAPFEKENRELVRRYFPAARASGGRHDALYDVEAAIAEMAFYRQRLLGTQG